MDYDELIFLLLLYDIVLHYSIPIFLWENYDKGIKFSVELLILYILPKVTIYISHSLYSLHIVDKVRLQREYIHFKVNAQIA